MSFLDGFNIQLVAGQLLLGALNGAFYAVLSLGLAVIFGLLNVVNFLHGTMYMAGAFAAWFLLDRFGIPYWSALLLAPAMVAVLAVPIEILLLRKLYPKDHLYGLLVTFGLALVVESVFRIAFGASGKPYSNPLPGGIDLGLLFLPKYRLWAFVAALAASLAAWIVIEKTKVGAYLRAATERPDIVQALGVNVPLLRTATYAGGAALAAFAGVLAAPIYQVSPSMGNSLMVVVFAVVVVGGMGSIPGAILIGISLGLLEAAVKMTYPEGASMVIFVMMIGVLLLRPAGLLAR